MDLLIAAGAPVNTPYCSYSIQIAAYCGHVSVLEKLIAAGADIAVVDGNGRTALHYARASGELEALRLLISHGANFTARDSSEATCLHYAATSDDNLEMAALVLDFTMDLLEELGAEPFIAEPETLNRPWEEKKSCWTWE